jgi:hypothetical protein
MAVLSLKNGLALQSLQHLSTALHPSETGGQLF